MLQKITLPVLLAPLLLSMSACSSESQQGAASPQAVQVIVASVKTQPFSDRIEALGTTLSNESVRISPIVTDKIVAIDFADGQHIKKGDVIVKLDDTAEQADLRAARSSLVEKQRGLQRSRNLREKNIVSEAELELARAEMESAQAQVERLEAAVADRTIRAPFDGRLGLRRVSVGTLVQPGDVITTLDDLSVVKVDFSVPSSVMGRLEPGLPIRGRTAAYPENRFEGELASLDTQVSTQTRSIAARAIMPNPDGLLRPGLLIELEVLSRERTGLAVPEAALVPRGEQQFLYLVQDEKAVRRQVRIGVRQDGRVEVLEGVKAGDQVVIHGAEKLAEGTAVSIRGSVDDGRSVEDILRAEQQ